MLSRRAYSGICLLLLSLTRRVGAQSSDAEARYNQGLKAFEEGNYVVACQQLAESYRLDPLPGALFTLATCEMRSGRVATAASRFSEFLALVRRLPAEAQQRQTDRLAVAERERAQLYARVPRLKLVLDARASAAEVTLNGAVLPSSSVGVELAVDPGEQLIEERSRNGKVFTQRISLAERESKLVRLEPDTTSGAGASGPSADASLAGGRAAGHALPYVFGGVGVAGLVVGAIAGGLAMGEASTVKDQCAGPACSPDGKRAAERGRAEALASTIGFGVGLAGIAAGVVLLTTSEGRKPVPQSARVELRLTPRSIAFKGQF
jgi:hypothetical protein